MRPRPLLLALLFAALVSACGGGGIVGSADGGRARSDSTVPTTVTSTIRTTTTITTAGSVVRYDSTDPTSTSTTKTTAPSPTTTRAATETRPTTPLDEGEVPGDLLDRVLGDASARLGTEALEVTVAEAVEWPDGALGCPEPGVSYTQAITPGYRVVVAGAGRGLDYRLKSDGAFKICDHPTVSPRDGDS